MKSLFKFIFPVILLIVVFIFFINKKQTNYTIIPIAKVPASFPVNFNLYSYQKHQFVAFYDSIHQMTLAKRTINNSNWEFQSLNSKIDWDSHNYLSIAIDKKGIIHLVGNMHSSPLVYYRSSKPFDIHSMKEIHAMVGKEEAITTYPEFITNANGDLIFHYRFGVSGSGYEIYNIWDSNNQQWNRLLDTPLTDGQGQMNAYMQGPLLGDDGYYHLLWVWRDSADCATNHTLSYAKSIDLIHWESVNGTPIELPITINNKETYVDPTPIYGGLINIGLKIGFDTARNVLAGYHKYDKDGNTQLFVARFENNKWNIQQITNWDYRWDFKGYGTIKNELLIESPRPSENKNEIIFGFHHTKYGDGQIVIDNKTLEPIRNEYFKTTYPKEIDSLLSLNPNMVINKVFDNGIPSDNKKYMLRWETLPPNNDKKPSNNLPNALLELIAY